MSVRRIVVAMDMPGAMAVTTAVDLARTLEAELLGLFVEDVQLFDLAALPFAGEVGFPSATRRVLDVEALERSLRAQAGRLRQDLMTRLAGVPTKWTFEWCAAASRRACGCGRRTGSRGAANAARGTGRRLSRGQVARAFGQLRAPLLLVDESHRHRRAIGVIVPADTEPAAIVDVLRGLAPFDGHVVRFVAIGCVAGWDAWQARMSGRLALAGLSGRFRSIAAPEAGELGRLLAKARAAWSSSLRTSRGTRDGHRCGDHSVAALAAARAGLTARRSAKGVPRVGFAAEMPAAALDSRGPAGMMGARHAAFVPHAHVLAFQASRRDDASVAHRPSRRRLLTAGAVAVTAPLLVFSRRSAASMASPRTLPSATRIRANRCRSRSRKASATSPRRSRA